MRYRVVSHFLGLIAVGLLLAFLTCVVISLFFVENLSKIHTVDKWGLVLLETGCWCLGLLMIGKRPSTPITHREALLTVGIGWLFMTYLGGLPFHYVANQSIANSLFEAASGFTTTGSTIFADVESLPKSILFWRAFSQWLGGLGIVIFVVAFVSSLGVTGKSLFANESGNKPVPEHFERAKSAAYQAVIIYCTLSIFFTILLCAAGVDLFNAVCHMATALSTGGFSNFNNNVGHYNNMPMVQWILIVLMILGATSFIVLGWFLKGQWKKILKNDEFLTYIGILVIGCSCVFYILDRYFLIGSTGTTFRHTVLQCVSFATTTGFSSVDYQLWPDGTHLIMMIIMVIGGCSGSTAGGLKIVRLMTGAKVFFAGLKRTINPRAVYSISIYGQPLQNPVRDAMLLYIVISMIIWGIGFAGMSLFEPHMSVEGIISGFWTAWANAGVSFAELGPTQNFNFCTRETKLLLTFVMLAGRIEVYALLVLFMPALWKRFD